MANCVPGELLDLDDGTSFFAHCNLQALIKSEDKAQSEKALLICKKLLKRPDITLTTLFGDDLESRDRYH